MWAQLVKFILAILWGSPGTTWAGISRFPGKTLWLIWWQPCHIASALGAWRVFHQRHLADRNTVEMVGPEVAPGSHVRCAWIVPMLHVTGLQTASLFLHYYKMLRVCKTLDEALQRETFKIPLSSSNNGSSKHYGCGLFDEIVESTNSRPKRELHKHQEFLGPCSLLVPCHNLGPPWGHLRTTGTHSQSSTCLPLPLLLCLSHPTLDWTADKGKRGHPPCYVQEVAEASSVFTDSLLIWRLLLLEPLSARREWGHCWHFTFVGPSGTLSHLPPEVKGFSPVLSSWVACPYPSPPMTLSLCSRFALDMEREAFGVWKVILSFLWGLPLHSWFKNPNLKTQHWARTPLF